MLRRVAPSLRRAILTSSAHGRAGAQLTEPGLSPPHALLPQWRLCSSAASAKTPPPPPSPPQGTTRPAGGSTVSSLNPAEVAKFAAIAETWWDSEGPFKPLHLMNPTRLSFIRSTLCRHFRRDPNSSKPLEGLKVIDVGCGGGILSEPLARMGATVTGIDAVDKNIKIARVHAVIEHVANPSGFCESLSALTVPNGATVISTINRSMRAYATAIVAAEYILNWLPKGTHQWSKLVTPEELVLILERASISVQEMAGFVYNPLRGEWSLSDDLNVNYIAYGMKKVETPSDDAPPPSSVPPASAPASSSSSTSAARRGVRLAEHGQSPPQSAPPPPSPSNTQKDAVRTPGGGSAASSLNPAEVAHFASFAETWRDPNSSNPLEGLKIIDVGCAAGMLSEPLARMGATVTGIDAADESIKIARVHAASDPLTASIEYFCTTAGCRHHLQDSEVQRFLVIEHVDNPSEFCESLSALTVPNGATVISTINRSIRAFGV
uniref:Ubiquinone biosynthesis O-methyltransferase, mitochondrial n=1 Tax=Oryza meridionalis TaxID=40149 RepID=A0A0E0DX29_9ORYZ